MKLYRQENQLCFDDILLVPNPSAVESRKNVDLSMSIGYGNRKIDLYLPVISSPMDTVTESEMAVEVAKFGGLGIIHRYSKIEDQAAQVFEVSKKGYAVGASVPTSVRDSVLPQVKSLVYVGAKVILVDTANGHNFAAIKAVSEIRKEFPDIHIMAGNVSTWDGFLHLSQAGADSVRVGIGGGSCCSTRIMTGHGIPTLASIMEIYEYQERLDLPTSIIADGGIRNSGDMVKSFAAGADAVMVGSMLSGHTESPGNVFREDGKDYKRIRGMASSHAQKDWRGSVSGEEGISTKVLFKGPAENTLNSIRNGISSGCSYAGVERLEELSITSQYVKVSPLSVKESLPHV